MHEFRFLTTAQTAQQLGLSVTRIKQLLGEQRLYGYLVGGVWLIDPVSVVKFQKRPSGYPKGKPRLKHRSHKAKTHQQPNGITN